MRVEQIMTRDVLTIGPGSRGPRGRQNLRRTGHLGLARVRCAARGSRSRLGGGHPVQGAGSGRERTASLVPPRSQVRKEDEQGARDQVLDAMTSPAITVSPYCSVAEAARLMSEHGVNRLPVIKGDDLVGIVTRTDLVRAFTRSDEEIREEIEEDLFRRTFWLGAPEVVVVEVTRGAVRLTGNVDTRSEAELLERLSARVPGVISLEADLTWAMDDTTRKAKREYERWVA